MKILPTIFFVLFCATVLFLSIRGIQGNPTSANINNPEWKDEGPLELSPERGRFALTYSIVEDKSFYFSLPIARFATPDLGYKNGKYVSLFAPGVSFLIIPGYLIGKVFGIAQVGSYFVISFFALLDAILVGLIARKLGASYLASLIGSLVFLFATPFFAYAVSLYQHSISIFLILLSIYVLIRWNNFWSISIVWLLIAASISVDYPNLILMLPIGLFALVRFFVITKREETLKIGLKLLRILSFIALLPPILFFLWFNQASYGNPYQLAGTVPGVKAIDIQGKPTAPEGTRPEDLEKRINPDLQNKTSIGFFNTRSILNGFYVHFISPDRGILFYTPVILFGILGGIYIYKKNPRIAAFLMGIVGLNILLYSMWGDPWGGWAFGSRYLIPSYALLSIFIAIFLTSVRRFRAFVFLLFFVVMAYSIAVNTLGALTSNRNAPKIEILSMEALSGKEEKYTYERNWEFLMANKSKSFIYQIFAKDYVTAPQYYYLIAGSIILVMGGQITYMYLKARKKS